jgi:calcineurin-like phosphoesterase family protein
MNHRNDIDIRNTWVVSDTHFGHENIKSYCHRPPDVEQTMMENWAREVPDDATVIHLGDLSYKSNAFFKNMIAPHLTGERKLIVLGNHDKQRYSFYRESGFKPVKPFYIVYGGYTISLSHYPWSEEYDGSPEPPEHHLRLHGHIHNNGYTRHGYVPFVRRHVNLSAEQTKYTPVNLFLLLEGVLFGRVPQWDGESDS